AIHEGLVGLGLWPAQLRDLKPVDAQRLAAEYLQGALARRRDGRKIICGPEQKAGKGIRTLDIQLGKLTLYQLSYARVGGGV
ncbi:MAG: hypothetical protein RLY72_1787, partial [Planctomycetota bacterium]